MLRQISPSRSRFSSTLSASTSSASPQRLNNSVNHRLPSPESRRHTGERPTLPRCYLCGQQFGTRSIGIHIPQCYAKKMAQWAIADPRSRGQPPKHPDTVNWRGEGQSALQQSEEQFQEFVRNLEPCPHCGRRFIADRLQVHLRSCRPGHTARPITPSNNTNNNTINNDNNLSRNDSLSKPHTPPNRFASSSPSVRPHSPSLAQVKSIIGSNNNSINNNKKNSMKANTLPAISPNNKTSDKGNNESVGHDKRVCPLTNHLPGNVALHDQSRTCPSCQTVEYDSTARFCKECGHELPEVTHRPLAHGCIHCGDALPTRARFCPTCGEPVEEVERTEAINNNNTQEKHQMEQNDKYNNDEIVDMYHHTGTKEYHNDNSVNRKASNINSTSTKKGSNSNYDHNKEEEQQHEEYDGNTSAEQVSLGVRMSACPACKTLCDADGNFCDHCGAALGEEELVTRNTHKDKLNNNEPNAANDAYCMYCATCKEKVEDMTSIYCEECGCKLEKRLKCLVTVPQTLPPLEQSNAIKALRSALQPTNNTTTTSKNNFNNSEKSGESPREHSNSPQRTVKSSLNKTPTQNQNQPREEQEKYTDVHHNSYNNNYNNNFDGIVEEGLEEEEERRQCPRCNRCFALSSYARHVQVCNSQKARKVFNMRKQRLSGLEVPAQRSYNNANNYDDIKLTPPSMKKDWRAESRAFRQALREARKVDAMLQSGAPLHNLPPPTYSENANYIQCPHCTRRFAPEVAARHIPRCATTINKPKPPPQHPPRRREFDTFRYKMEQHR